MRKTERCSKVLVDNMTSCLVSFALLNGWNRTKNGVSPTSFREILTRKIGYRKTKKKTARKERNLRKRILNRAGN